MLRCVLEPQQFCSYFPMPGLMPVHSVHPATPSPPSCFHINQKGYGILNTKKDRHLVEFFVGKLQQEMFFFRSLNICLCQICWLYITPVVAPSFFTSKVDRAFLCASSHCMWESEGSLRSLALHISRPFVQ